VLQALHRKPAGELNWALLGSQEKDETEINKLCPLKAVYPEGFNAVGSPKEDWVEVEFAVDSGATDTVMNEESLGCIETKAGMAFRQGVEYAVANGVRIPNEGEKEFVGVTEEGLARSVKAQVCAVTTCLLSVKKIVAAGHNVMFGQESYIEDVETGERIHMTEREGMYMVKFYVKNEPF
jgi:hypothetical protein